MLARPIYQTMGFAFVALGVLGVFLPLLPTTPFLLAAAACFARSSEKWHTWLLSNKTFGPIIRDWEASKCISGRVKAVAITSMLVLGGYSIFFALDHRGLQIFGGILIAIGLITILRIDTCKPIDGS